MPDIKELSLKELEAFLKEKGQPTFHARQIFSWIYKRKAKGFKQMTDLSSALRKHLEENFFIFASKLIKAQASSDGTKKFLFELADGNLVEAVIIPAKDRVTGCISTQVGCKFGCRFCASGILGFKRNLTLAEIIEQVLYLNNTLSHKITHLVFMGTGEPLDNYENVLKAIRTINSKEAFAIGARRITVSTCGLIPGIKRLAQEGLQIELSVSLHAADESTRSQIMPVNKKFPLEALLLACEDYIKKTNRQITFEYVLAKGINSDLQNALNLSKILADLNCKVNLIPCNPIPELDIEPPNKTDILIFKNYLLKKGIHVTLRRPRGKDIDAACGQLRMRHENK